MMLLIAIVLVVSLLIAYNVYTTYSHDIDTFHYHNVWHYLAILGLQVLIVIVFLVIGYFIGKVIGI